MDLSKYIIQPDTSVLDATAAINASGKQIVFVCDGVKLLAVFTDSELRRYILNAGDLTLSVTKAANYNPIILTNSTQFKAQKLLRDNIALRGIPIVDDSGNLVHVVFADNTDAFVKQQLDIPVVIMAGGKGTRLAPYTNVLPKPLIPVGDKTITEHIMKRFSDIGCNDFTMIVNYKKELIKTYFNELSCEINIRFIDESVFQGTGGGLKLLEGIITGTFILTNCDILVETDYTDILEHHRNSGALITMVCALMTISVPYGIVELDETGKPSRLVEKPDYPILTNTGLYVVEPEFLDNIQPNEFVDITEIIQRLADGGKPIGVYPITESDWLDMGQPEEFMRMERYLQTHAN